MKDSDKTGVALNISGGTIKNATKTTAKAINNGTSRTIYLSGGNIEGEIVTITPVSVADDYTGSGCKINIGTLGEEGDYLVDTTKVENGDVFVTGNTNTNLFQVGTYNSYMYLTEDTEKNRLLGTNRYPVLFNLNYENSASTYYITAYQQTVFTDLFGNTNQSLCPNRKGYAFGGWYSDRNYSEQIIDPSGSFIADTSLTTTVGNWKSLVSDTVLYAKWTSKVPTPTYTVTFDANGHGTAPTTITNIASGSKITAPVAPTATDYTFGGWYKESSCTNEWDFTSDTVTADTTLYAKWTKEETHPDPNPTPVVYHIISGANSIWIKNGDGTVTITGDGAKEDFISVKVDGKVIDSKNYDVKSGATIIILKKSFLDTLSTDEHSFEIVWTDGSASTKFTVKENKTDPSSDSEKIDPSGDSEKTDPSGDSEKTDPSSDSEKTNPSGHSEKTDTIGRESPKTGDDSPILLWILVFMGAGTGLTVTASKRCKK